jgi:hypothetical protein
MVRRHLLAAASVVLLACLLGACDTTSAPSPVTASTRPDAVHIAITRVVLSTREPPRALYGHTFTNASTVARLAQVLNAAPDEGAARELPYCGADYTTGTPPGYFGFPWYMFRLTFTAHGRQTVERVDMSMRCDGVGVRRGLAPTTVRLGVEVGANAAMQAALHDVVDYVPSLPGSGPGTRICGPPPPTPTPLP